MLVRMTIISNGVNAKQNKKYSKKEPKPKVLTSKSVMESKKKIKFKTIIKTSILIPSRLFGYGAAHPFLGLEMSSPRTSNIIFIIMNIT